MICTRSSDSSQSYRLNPWSNARCCSPFGKAASVRASGRPYSRCYGREGCPKAPQLYDRARLLAWMLLYYRDDGAIFSAQNGQVAGSHYAEWYGVLARARAEAAQEYLTQSAFVQRKVRFCGCQRAD